MKKEVKKKSRGMSAFLKAKKKGSAYYEIIIKTLVFIYGIFEFELYLQTCGS